MNFSRKNQRTLLYVIGILLIIAVYFLYFTNKQSELDEAQNEVNELKSEVDTLKEYETHMLGYKEDIETFYGKIENMTKDFPLDVKEENVVMYSSMLEFSGIGVTGVTIGDPTLLDTFGSGERKKKLYATQAQIVFGGSYNQTKEIIETTMNYPQKRNIVALTLTRDEETGVLVGNVTMNLYTLKGSGQVYDKPHTGVIVPERKPDIFE